jgi:hypothetical protein
MLILYSRNQTIREKIEVFPIAPKVRFFLVICSYMDRIHRNCWRIVVLWFCLIHVVSKDLVTGCYGVGFYAILGDWGFLIDELRTQVQTYDK